MEEAAMSSQIATGGQTAAKAAAPKVVAVESLTDKIESIYRSITERAYELFHGRGGVEGDALDDWFRAESELLKPMSVEILESDGDVIVHADVPGFRAADIELSVEPMRLTITGKHEESSERKIGERVYTERSSNQIYRTLALPAEVEPGKATATIADGVLTLTMAKIPKPKPEPAEVKSVEVKEG